MQHTRSMSPRLLATLLVLVFAAVRTSAATCADGSSPGSNGCCAATNECPPCCVYKVVQTNGDGTKECRCHFCEGVTAKIDAACTSPPPPAGEVAVRSSCPAEYPTYAGGVLAQMFASIATTMEPSRGKNKPR